MLYVIRERYVLQKKGVIRHLNVSKTVIVTMVFTAMGLRPAIQILGYVRLDQRLIAVTI
jgi:hypothetical protein